MGKVASGPFQLTSFFGRRKLSRMIRPRFLCGQLAASHGDAATSVSVMGAGSAGPVAGGHLQEGLHEVNALLGRNLPQLAGGSCTTARTYNWEIQARNADKQFNEEQCELTLAYYPRDVSCPLFWGCSMSRMDMGNRTIWGAPQTICIASPSWQRNATSAVNHGRCSAEEPIHQDVHGQELKDCNVKDLHPTAACARLLGDVMVIAGYSWVIINDHCCITYLSYM